MSEPVASIHTIRLRGPWECRPLAWARRRADGAPVPIDAPLPAAGLLVMPADWSPVAGADFRGRVRFTRRFGCPTGLTAEDHVSLVVEAVDFAAEVTLNEVLLGAMRWGDGPWRGDITARLQAVNELRIEVELSDTLDGVPNSPRSGRESLPGGLIGEVRLEIRSREPQGERNDDPRPVT